MSRQTDIQQLIINYTRRLQKLKEQQALKGQGADPDLLIEIEDIEAQLGQLQTELATLVDETEPGATVPVSEIKGTQMSDEDKSKEGGIHFGSQATVQGDVFTGGKRVINTGGGDFVGRDKHVHGDEVHYHYYRPMFGKPFQIPSLPAHFVPRPEVTDALKACLLADSPTTPGILVASAIHGLGRIGKSTLAAALAHDKEVQQRFKDGILWATLGQQPDLLSLLSGWVQALGDYDFRPMTVEAASTHLRSLLHNKAVLLVVDDVWDPAPAEFFRVGGPQCHVLITTREAVVAKVVKADLYELEVMTQQQALSLMSKQLGHELEKAEQDQAKTLAKTVGYLPLALELAAAQVADGVFWSELLADLQAEIAQLELLNLPEAEEVKDEVTLKHLSLRASLYLSLRRLSADKLRCFVWLGILPEDVNLTPAMAATLWDTSLKREICYVICTIRLYFYQMYRCQIIPEPTVYTTCYTDLARSLLQASAIPTQTNDLPGLGLTPPAAHAALLARYQKRTQNGLWHTLPDDGYVHAHLTWHMERAGQIEQIHALLREETTEERNGWYQIREQLGQTAGFLKDVGRAQELVTKSDPNHQSPVSIGLQCRYALIIASLNSLAQNILPELLGALVTKEVWSSAQGLSYACCVLDAEQRAQVLLVGLIPHLSEPLKESALQEALVAVQAIKDEKSQAKVLPRLAKLGYLTEALTIAWQVKQKSALVEALTGIVPDLSEIQREKVLRKALIEVQRAEDTEDRSEALTKLVPQLAQFSHPEEALTIAQVVEGNELRMGVLVELAPLLPKPLREQAVQEALVISDGLYN